LNQCTAEGSRRITATENHHAAAVDQGCICRKFMPEGNPVMDFPFADIHISAAIIVYFHKFILGAITGAVTIGITGDISGRISRDFINYYVRRFRSGRFCRGLSRDIGWTSGGWISGKWSWRGRITHHTACGSIINIDGGITIPGSNNIMHPDIETEIHC